MSTPVSSQPASVGRTLARTKSSAAVRQVGQAPKTTQPTASPKSAAALPMLPMLVHDVAGKLLFVSAQTDPREHLLRNSGEHDPTANRWSIPSGHTQQLLQIALATAAREVFPRDAEFVIMQVNPNSPQTTARAVSTAENLKTCQASIARHESTHPSDVVFPLSVSLCGLTREPLEPLPADHEDATVNDRLADIPEKLRPFVFAHGQRTNLNRYQLQQRAIIAQRINCQLGKDFKTTFNPGAILNERDRKGADHLYAVRYLPETLAEIVADDRRGKLVPQIARQLMEQGQALLEAAARLTAKCRV
jgi:hypothetical protein